MAGSFEISSGVMTITKDGRTVFDTSRPLMNLVPSAAIELADYDIEFPDLHQGVIYHQHRETPILGTDNFGCMSFAGLIEQEWGPAESSPYTIADVVLGAVPDGTDYLDVRVNLTNTVVPAGWFDLTMRSNIPSGQWVKLEGGSCLIEGFPGLRRLFEIIIDDGNAVLRRYQSVTADGQANRSTYVQSTANTTNPGPYVGFVPKTNAPVASGLKALYGAIIQGKGLSNSPPSPSNWGPSGSNACSTTSPSYASTWSGDIIITPGRISA